MKALYPQANGEIAIIFLQDWDNYHEVCKRVTPHNTPYLICEDADLPSDWSTSAAWECDFSHPHGIGMGPQRYFIAQAEANIVDILARAEPVAPETVLPDAFVPDPEKTDEENEVTQANYMASVIALNNANTARHQKALVAFFTQQDNDQERELALIEQMKAEVFQIEGVVL